MRERTAEGILRMLGKRPTSTEEPQADSAPSPDDTPFGVEERNMVSGVLRLADRNVHSIMTPRTDLSWIDLDDAPEDIRKEISDTTPGFFPVCRGTLDHLLALGGPKEKKTGR